MSGVYQQQQARHQQRSTRTTLHGLGIVEVAGEAQRYHAPMACKRSMRATRVIAAVLVAAYLLSWPASSIIWRQISTERVAEQTDHPYVNGVRIEVWTNPTNSDSHRSLLVPFIRYHERRGPHVLGVRFIDTGFTAKGARIDSAAIEFPTGSVSNLRLVSIRGGESGQWMPFFQNASQFIVHAFNELDLYLPDQFVLRIEVSVHNRGITQQQVHSIRLRLKDRVYRTVGFPSI